MARPVVSAIAEDLYSRLGPWRDADGETTGWALLTLCQALVGGLQPVEDVVRDDDDGPGWSKPLDADRAPADWLPWLAQFAGVRLMAGLTEQGSRIAIKGTAAMHRGSPGAIKAAARAHLVGPDGTGDSAYVIVNERLAGNAYQLGVRTLTGETPDAAAVERAIREQKPGGIVLNFATVPGQTYDTVATAFDTYTELDSAYATYTAMEQNLPT